MGPISNGVGLRYQGASEPDAKDELLYDVDFFCDETSCKVAQLWHRYQGLGFLSGFTTLILNVPFYMMLRDKRPGEPSSYHAVECYSLMAMTSFASFLMFKFTVQKLYSKRFHQLQIDGAWGLVHMPFRNDLAESAYQELNSAAYVFGNADEFFEYEDSLCQKFARVQEFDPIKKIFIERDAVNTFYVMDLREANRFRNPVIIGRIEVSEDRLIIKPGEGIEQEIDLDPEGFQNRLITNCPSDQAAVQSVALQAISSLFYRTLLEQPIEGHQNAYLLSWDEVFCKEDPSPVNVKPPRR